MITFNSLEEAVEAFFNAEEGSELQADAFCYIFENGPEDLKEILRAGTRKFFPNLKPDYYDKDGNPLYSVERVAKEFGITEEEAIKITKGYGVFKMSRDDIYPVQ